MFVGRHERQLDPKGRLALPSAFRPRFEPRCYLAMGRDGCIDVFTPEAFEQMATETMEKVKRGEIRHEQRALAAGTFVARGRPGRISIDRSLRISPGWSSRGIVSGSFDRVEIWNARPTTTWWPVAAAPKGAYAPTPAARIPARRTRRKGGEARTTQHPRSRSSAVLRSARWQPKLRPLPSGSSGRHPGGNRRPGGCR